MFFWNRKKKSSDRVTWNGEQRRVVDRPAAMNPVPDKQSRAAPVAEQADPASQRPVRVGSIVRFLSWAATN